MQKIELEPGQTVETADPQVRVTVPHTASLVAASLKMVLVVETEDGRRSAPAELRLSGEGGPEPV